MSWFAKDGGVSNRVFALLVYPGVQRSEIRAEDLFTLFDGVIQLYGIRTPPKEGLVRFLDVSPRKFTKGRMEALCFLRRVHSQLPHFHDIVPGLTREVGSGLSILGDISHVTIVEFGVFLIAVRETGGTTVVETHAEFAHGVGGFNAPIHVDLFGSYSDHVLTIVSSVCDAVCGTAGTARHFAVLVAQPFHGGL